MNRGADRQDVFCDPSDYRRFEWLLGDATSAAGVEVHAYCLMTNHFHLLVRCREAGLSDAMHSLESRYARWFNDRYERDGPIFRGRFRSVLVESDEQMLTVWRYIHRNPLAFVPKQALAAYEWSSFGVYLGRRTQTDWLLTGDVSACLGSDVDALRQFVETDVPSDLLTDDFYDRFRSVTCDQIEHVTAAAASVDPSTIGVGGRGATNIPRMLAISLSVELRIAPTSDLAARYGLTPSSVRTTARRGRVLASSDEQFRDLRERVLAHLCRTG